MRHARVTHLLLAIFAALGVACSGGSHGGGGTGGGATPDDFCASLAAIQCSLLSTCCAQEGTPIVVGSNCSILETASCEDQLATLRAKGGAWDPIAANQCLANMQSLSAIACDRSVHGSLFDPCAMLYRGPSVEAGPCDSTADCALLAKGELTCVLTSSGGGPFIGSCVRRRALGATCAFATPCERGLWCKADGGGSTCVPAGSSGAACDPMESSSCTTGLSCLSETRTCGPPPRPGQRCPPLGQDCAAPAYCAFAKNVCTMPGAIGEACDTASTNSCVPGAYCTKAGTCAAHKGVGEACANDDECVSDQCTGDKCVINPACNALGG